MQLYSTSEFALQVCITTVYIDVCDYLKHLLRNEKNEIIKIRL